MRSVILAVFSLLMLSASASADTYDFTITGSVTGSGVLTVGTAGPGLACLSQAGVNGLAPIVGMTGTFDGAPITLLDATLAPVTAQTNPCNESYWYAEENDVDWSLPTIFSAGGDVYEFWEDATSEHDLVPDFMWNQTTGAMVPDFTITYAEVAEPGTLALLCAGLALLVCIRLRKAED